MPRASRDGTRRLADDAVVIDLTSDLRTFVDDTWYNENVLHEAYDAPASSKHTAWRDWCTTPRSKLVTFVAPEQTVRRLYNGSDLPAVLEQMRATLIPKLPFVKARFRIHDWDFTPALWELWEDKSKEDEGIWARVLEHVVGQHRPFWKTRSSAKVEQVSTTGTTQSVTTETPTSAWIVKLRDKPCLQDTGGTYRRPRELLVRSPETEPLADLEPFVRANLDTEAVRPLLLMLGASDKSTGPDALLARLHELSQSASPPLYELERWYRRLAQMIVGCSDEEQADIQRAFAMGRLVYTSDGTWAKTGEVFLATNDDDIPGATLVHKDLKHLSIWATLGIAERPTVDRALEWLGDLETEKALTTGELRQVRSLLALYPERIWRSCHHWLNLLGEWMPVASLDYALTMQSLVPWKHLFDSQKRRIADLQRLSSELCEMPPFSGLKSLSAHLIYRVGDEYGSGDASETKVWLHELGFSLRRLTFSDQTEAEAHRQNATRLMESRWTVTPGLKTLPYLDGEPAGAARRSDAVWQGKHIYVRGGSAAAVARAVANELTRAFGTSRATEALKRSDIGDAIKLCYERSASFVREYMEENFDLAPEDIDDTTRTEKLPETDELPARDAFAATPETSIVGDEGDSVDRHPTTNHERSSHSPHAESEKHGKQERHVRRDSEDAEEGQDAGDSSGQATQERRTPHSDADTQGTSNRPHRPRKPSRDRYLSMQLAGDQEIDRAEGSGKDPQGKKDDYKARQAVVAYEQAKGRDARAMDDRQPGFDVSSLCPSTNRERRIEVKGTQDLFAGPAAVALSSRQYVDALKVESDDIEYWLYVVDSTETLTPRVYPIPWTRRKGHFRYLFHATTWLQDAEDPAVVTSAGLEDLPLPPRAEQGQDESGGTS